MPQYISVGTVKMLIEPSEVLTIVEPTYSLYTAVILTTVDAPQITKRNITYIRCKLLKLTEGRYREEILITRRSERDGRDHFTPMRTYL